MKMILFKDKNQIFLALFLILLISPLISAEQINAPSQQTIKTFLNPFYRSSLTNNVNISYNLSIVTPSSISKVQSAVVSFDVYLTPTVTFSLWVNNISCNNPTFVVSTTFASAGQSRITFDCSNVITTNGDYNIIFRASGANTGAISGWLDLTYYSSSQGSIDIHGTEYTFGQIAKPWLQLLNSSGDEVNSAVCFMDIYTPAAGYLVERAVMINFNHDGIYYYDINPVPSIEGVYPVIAKCHYISVNTPNFATSVAMINGTLDSGDVGRTNISDGIYMTTSETSVALGNPRRYWAEFNFSRGKICDINELLLSGIDISFVGRWNSNVAYDNITISIWNYTSSSWLSLPNHITGSGTGVKSISNSFALTNITKAGFVNASGTNLRLKFQDYDLADASSTGMDYDYLSVSCEELASPKWEIVRGSSELHVSDPSNWAINVTATTTINNTEVAGAVWNYTGTINNNILSQFSTNIWAFTNRTLSSFNSLINDIWSNTNRNLTYYPDNTNYARINQGVWNNTDRNLTFYPSQIDLTNYARINQGVWNNTDRNLTYYEVSNINITLNNISANDIANAVWNYTGTINDNILDQFANKFQCLIDQALNSNDGWGIDLSIC